MSKTSPAVPKEGGSRAIRQFRELAHTWCVGTPWCGKTPRVIAVRVHRPVCPSWVAAGSCSASAEQHGEAAVLALVEQVQHHYVKVADVP